MILLEAIAKLFPEYTFTDSTTEESKTIDLTAELNKLSGNALDDAASEYLTQYLDSKPGTPYEKQVGEVLNISSFKNALITSILLWGPDGSNINKNPIIYFLENTVIPKSKIEAVGAIAIPAICDAIEEDDLPLNAFNTYFIKNDTGIFDEKGNAFTYRFDILKIFLDQRQIKRYKSTNGDIPTIDWIYNNSELIGKPGYPESVKTKVTNKFLPYSDMKLVAQSLTTNKSSKDTESLKKVMSDIQVVKPEDINKELNKYFDDVSIQKELKNKTKIFDYKDTIAKILTSKDNAKITTFLNSVEVEAPFDPTRIIQAVEDYIINPPSSDDGDTLLTFKDIIKNRGWTLETLSSQLLNIIKNNTSLKDTAKSTLRTFLKSILQTDETRKDFIKWQVKADTDAEILNSIAEYRKALSKNKISGLDILARELGLPKKALNIKHLQNEAIKLIKKLKRPDTNKLIKRINKGSMDDMLKKTFNKKYIYNSSDKIDNMLEINNNLIKNINTLAKL